MATTPRFGYLIAVAATLAAAAFRLVLNALLANDLPYLTFFGAIMVAGWYGGFQPGLLATFLSTAATSSFFLAPRLALHQLRAGDIVGLLVFVATGCLISLLCERLHRARNGQQLEAERLRTTLQSIGDGVIVTDEAGRIISLNTVAEGLTGWRDTEAGGRALPDVFRILNEETRREVENPALRALREGAITGLANHTVLVAKNGEERPIDDSAAPVRNRSGEVIGSILVFRDVAARRRTNEMQGLLAAVVESSEDAVISKSLEGHIMSWNAGAQAMFGYSAEEAIGRYVGFLMPEELLQEEQALLARVGRGERVTTFETVRCRKDGQRLDVSLSLSPIRNESGVIIGASSIARDIRRRKELERTLRETDRRKDAFLATLAHELRNPLAPIRNSVAALRLAKVDDPQLRRTCAIIERQVQQMARLLDDLLDVSRITHDKLELRREPVTIQTLLNMAVETSQPNIDEKGQTLSLALPPQRIYVDADATRIAQVFSNILSNASKYSKPGATIRVAAEASAGEVVVTTVDDGIGISPEMLPTIFEMFSQAPQALAHAQGGIGIGLALVRGLVELHGGRVSAKSEGAGRGSTFEVRLPAATAPREISAQAEPERRLDGQRILVVDDNRDGADSLSMILSMKGHSVETAYDGPSAVAQAATFAPHVVFLDLGMPGMDGFEAARRIRALPVGATMTLIALTGWGQDRDRNLTREAGFDAHLVKPIDPLSIEDFLAALLPGRH
jgi:PAS domain S-box-containing protein